MVCTRIGMHAPPFMMYSHVTCAQDREGSKHARGSKCLSKYAEKVYVSSIDNYARQTRPVNLSAISLSESSHHLPTAGDT